jgi:hypothetical protein
MSRVKIIRKIDNTLGVHLIKNKRILLRIPGIFMSQYFHKDINIILPCVLGEA